MALLENLFKGNVLTGVAIGFGVVLLAPMAGQVLRPAAKAIIKGGMLAYKGIADLGEVASHMVAEAQAELAQEHVVATATAEVPAAPKHRPHTA